MQVLLLGSGGREHALAWKIAQSKELTKLYVAPGNAGTAQLAENIALNLNDFESIRQAILKLSIDLLLVGPEDPLVNGLVDFLGNCPELKNLLIIGPQKKGAMLEGSKEFAKQFMFRHNIPTAAYKSVNKETLAEGLSFLNTLTPPYVLKADGLAAGKGVLILGKLQEAEQALREMLGGKFGNAGNTVVIEEFLSGIELSVFALTDGKNYVLLPEAKDYKRIGEGDTGLNTGGMGAVSPVSFADNTFMQKIRERIIEPTIKGLQKEEIPYTGFIFFGLINVNGNPFVIEYNCRMGDPETEVVIPRIQNDLLPVLAAAGNGNLDTVSIVQDKKYATTVIAVSGGYPEAYEKDKEISGLDTKKESLVFHAGTVEKNGNIYTNGGRVLAITSMGKTKDEALKISYENLKSIAFSGMYYRKDIGYDLK